MLTFGGPQEPRTSTPVRVRQPPGGESSISLAWGNDNRDPPTPLRRSSRANPPPVSSISLAWESGAPPKNGFTPRTPTSHSRPGVFVNNDGRDDHAKDQAGRNRRPWDCQIMVDCDDEDNTETNSYCEEYASDYALRQQCRDEMPEDQGRCEGGFAPSDQASDSDWAFHRQAVFCQHRGGAPSSHQMRRSTSDVCIESSRQTSVVSDSQLGSRTPRSNARDGHAGKTYGNSEQSVSQCSDRPSSNAFARGSDQNCGNVLTGRPTTRIAAPPGGASSICFGSEDQFRQVADYGNATPRLTPRSGEEQQPTGKDIRRHHMSNEASQVSPRHASQRSYELPFNRVASGEQARPRTATPRSVTPRGSATHCNAVTPPRTPKSEARSVTPRSNAHRSSYNDGFKDCIGPEYDSTPRQAADEGKPRALTPRAATPRELTSRAMNPRALTPRESTPRAVTPRALTPRAQKADVRHSQPSVTSTAASSREDRCSRGLADRLGACDASETEAGSSVRYQGLATERPAGKPRLFDPNVLKKLKSRMPKSESSASSVVTPSGVSGSQIYNEDFGFGNSSHHGPAHLPQRSASMPRLYAKEEVEGSRPRKWHPAKAPKAPPGGAPTFHPAVDGKPDTRIDGKKQFSDIGAGSNRDANAIEALRFFQKEERLGKNAGPYQKLNPTKESRDSHRYYLAIAGQAHLAPGKARPSASMASECDSLPLGAEWSTCRGELPMF